eukprot:TRINITY_DN24006_c1_g3_i2.p1 TRINITY_DN24006_c1_g3~~TRINITY_DN24006_c1_g3_i2.p1  ORF type:complete len:1302 (-),score=233.15 TRINITY_DN24006_c1_g3_i2:201-3971(-)
MASAQTTQQEQVNSLLNQLPQQQRAQIEQAVKDYRQTLVSANQSEAVIQSQVWNYYTTCVLHMAQRNKQQASASTGAEDGAQGDNGASTQNTSSEQMEQSQASRIPQRQNMQQQQQYPSQAQQSQRYNSWQNQYQRNNDQDDQWEQPQQQQQQPQHLQEQWRQLAHNGQSQNMMGQQMMPGKGGSGMASSSSMQVDSGSDSIGMSRNAGTGGGWNSGQSSSYSTMGTPAPKLPGAVRPWKWAGNQSWGDSGNQSWGDGGNQSWGDASNDSTGGDGSSGSMGAGGSMGVGQEQTGNFGAMGNSGNGCGSWGCGGFGGKGMGMRPGIRFPINSGGRPSVAPGMSMPSFQSDSSSGGRWTQQPVRPGQHGGAWSVGGAAAPRVIAPRAVGIQLPGGGGYGVRPAGRPIQRPGLVVGAGGMGALSGGMAAGGLGAAARPPGAPAATRPFPPSLQNWLQRLFASQATPMSTDPQLHKITHQYLRHWVQEWVKSGELYKTNWDTARLPTAEEIRQNVAPGSLSGGARVVPSSASGFSAPSGFSPAPSAQVGANPKFGGKGAAFGAYRPTKGGEGDESRRSDEGFGQRYRHSSRSPRRGSRSRSGNRRRRGRSPHRRRRHRSSSTSRSRSRSRSRSASSRSRGSRSRDGSRDRKAGSGRTSFGGKGEGKLGKGAKTPEEMRQRVHTWLQQRLQAGDCRGRQKELQDEIQRSFGVNARRFKSLFYQTVPQYIQAFLSKGASGPEEAWTSAEKAGSGIQKGPKAISQGEQEMRAQRAQRFQSHLNIERATVAMVSFDGADSGGIDGGPIVGELTSMCSREEAREREQTRQLDKFEWKPGTDPKHPEVDLRLATKKYQRSSADKAYRSQDVRSLEACWRTMEYLMTEVLDFDENPKPNFAVQSVPYIEVYSFLRDRTRAVRVDLHLQQPRSTTQRTFVETHEVCLRFEMLSLFLLTRAQRPSKGAGAVATEKYDPKLGLKAISQTIEPLLNAYQAVRDKLVAKSILADIMGALGGGEGNDEAEEHSSTWEPAVHRYIVLLLMSFSPEELMTHLAKLSREVLSHPLVSFATQVHAAFQTDDYSRFLRFYRTADFLSAVAMSSIADLARLRALWLLFRTYPQPIGDKFPLERLKNLLALAGDAHARSFLAFHGVQVVDEESGAFVRMPKKGSPEAADHPLLSGPNRLPEKCDYPKGADSLLEAKYTGLGMTRAELIFGGADPIVTVPEEEAVPEVPEAEAPAPEEPAEPSGDAELAPVDPATVPAALE